MAEILIGHLLDRGIFSLIWVDCKGLPLPIERVYNVLLIIVKALIRKVVGGTIHNLRIDVAVDHFELIVVYEMVVCQGFVMKELYEDSLIRNKGASYERVSEPLDRHRMVVNAEGLVDVKLLFFDDRGVPRFFAENPQSELTIIDERYRIFFTGGILLNFFETNIAVIFTANLLFKGLLVILKTIHPDPKFPIVLFRDSYRSCRIV